MKTSKQFYTELKPERLAKRKKKIHTKKELLYLKKLLSKKGKILDLACGYGRFTIPLAKSGYDIEGIDITPSLIKKAKLDAKKEKLNIKFKVGDMRKLHYKNESFDNIICMWSAFIELIKKSDQIKTLKEMLRVLDKDGFALLELPYVPRIKKYIKVEKDEFTLKKDNVIQSKISGIEILTYHHNKKTLRELMKKSNIKKYKIFIDNFGGRDRLFLQFWKVGCGA